MANNKDSYISPLSTRYASAEMQHIFSENFKFRTWRRLWIALARAEQALGLDITDEQIAEMEAHKDDIDYATAEAREREVRHDVMAHVYAFGRQCPKAEPIIHLGATSVLRRRQHGRHHPARGVAARAAARRRRCCATSRRSPTSYKALPCLAYTHLQPAQLTTVGKRANAVDATSCRMDIENLEFQLGRLRLLGTQGHHRHAGQLHGAVRRATRRRCAVMEQLIAGGDGLCRLRAGLRPDVFAQGRRIFSLGALRLCPERL